MSSQCIESLRGAHVEILTLTEALELAKRQVFIAEASVSATKLHMHGQETNKDACLLFAGSLLRLSLKAQCCSARASNAKIKDLSALRRRLLIQRQVGGIIRHGFVCHVGKRRKTPSNQLSVLTARLYVMMMHGEFNQALVSRDRSPLRSVLFTELSTADTITRCLRLSRALNIRMHLQQALAKNSFHLVSIIANIHHHVSSAVLVVFSSEMK
mmetsp:Transcript_32210/g.99647  ORF Transcript_32210/g.99647 Transcript_32210/m.99647 type:complete len:213 (+) Transcript_32210:355-993(+)